MGNVNRSSSDTSNDEVTHRLPEDLQDPEQRELDDIPPESDSSDDASDSDRSGSADGSRANRGGAGGGSPIGSGGSTNSEVSSEGEEDDSNSEQNLLSSTLGGILSTDDDDELSTKGAGIPPSKLKQWSKSGPRTSPKRTKDTLSRVLENDSRLDKRDIEYRVFLQGSYKNHTNIHGNSDVDVVIQLVSPHRQDSEQFFHDTKEVRENGGNADYGYDDFRRDVVAALRDQYGTDTVIVDDKAIKVHASDSTLQIDADVVVCQKYQPNQGDEAMWFRSESGLEITNYPEQHYQKGAKKNQATNGNYRKTVRMFKRARQNLAHKDRLSKEDVPSYFVACLLSNVPNEAFVDDPQERYVRVVNYLHANRDNLSSFTAQHGNHELFGRESTRWNQRDAKQFIDELVWLYQNYYN